MSKSFTFLMPMATINDASRREIYGSLQELFADKGEIFDRNCTPFRLGVEIPDEFVHESGENHVVAGMVTISPDKFAETLTKLPAELLEKVQKRFGVKIKTPKDILKIPVVRSVNPDCFKQRLLNGDTNEYTLYQATIERGRKFEENGK